MNGNMNLGKRVSALEKDGGEDIKKEISDLQVAVTEIQASVSTAQEEISNLENKVNSGNVYSTEEKVVATWIDGKPIYQKTIAFTFVGSSTANIDISDNINDVLYAYAFAKNSKYMYNISMYTQGQGGQILYDYAKPNKLRIKNTNPDFDNSSGYVTVQYTKTTDNSPN